MDKNDRLIEAATAVLQFAPEHKLNAVTLNKVLFYLDVAALRDRGDTITHNSYIALEHGPVVAKYPKRLIGKLVEMGAAQQEDEWDGSKPISLLVPQSGFQLFNDELLELTSRIVSFFSKMSSTQASEYSHENPGWQIAWREGNRAGKPVAIDLHIALQQIIEDDPWMDLPLSSEESSFLDSADNAEGDEW